MNETDPDKAWDDFVFEFCKILDDHTPWKTMYFDLDLPQWLAGKCSLIVNSVTG